MKTFFIALAIVAYVIMNLVMAKLHNAKEMRQIIVDGQCAVGMVAANIFYAPAWALKVLRRIVVATIR